MCGICLENSQNFIQVDARELICIRELQKLDFLFTIVIFFMVLFYGGPSGTSYTKKNSSKNNFLTQGGLLLKSTFKMCCATNDQKFILK